ncbi:ribosomal protein L1-like protein [Kalaharituber pfeilii]|nr:ribosomal protein L1-like protein [Kalaharituber pfeilii]
MPPRIPPLPLSLRLLSAPVRPNPPLRPAIPLLALTRSYATPQKKNPNTQRKKVQRQHFRQYDLKDADQYSLYEAVRYLRAFEVGYDPASVKYELAVKLHAQKNGPTIKNRVKLPKPVKTDFRICVIAQGKHAEAALKAGAVIAGTDEVFEKIKAGKIDFDKCIAHEPCYSLLQKARVAPILGPRGLMPNPKQGTVVTNPAASIKDLIGAHDYRERMGVIRMAIGQLGFTEGELAKNIQAFMTSVKKDVAAMQHKTEKTIVEVVLSSTHGPGFSLSGKLKPSEEESATPKLPLLADQLGPHRLAAMA